MMDGITTIKCVVSGVFAAVTLGWGSHAYLTDTLSNYADKETVLVAGAKADYVIDRQMSAIIRDIAYLEQKPNKSPEQLAQLLWLREQLKEMREVRRGKKK